MCIVNSSMMSAVSTLMTITADANQNDMKKKRDASVSESTAKPFMMTCQLFTIISLCWRSIYTCDVCVLCDVLEERHERLQQRIEVVVVVVRGDVELGERGVAGGEERASCGRVLDHAAQRLHAHNRERIEDTEQEAEHRKQGRQELDEGFEDARGGEHASFVPCGR